MRFFIGPMSKNVVDAVINFDSDIGLIPSRRQVDYDGGYVNNWTTKEFSKYSKNIILKRLIFINTENLKLYII